MVHLFYCKYDILQEYTLIEQSPVHMDYIRPAAYFVEMFVKLHVANTFMSVSARQTLTDVWAYTIYNSDTCKIVMLCTYYS